jgi:hypothetical protein
MVVFKKGLNFHNGFLSSLDKIARITLFLLLTIQLIAYSFFLWTLPLHYDEWYSWNFFSGDSFYHAFTYYPAPNNHVFYNLVSRVFIVTGIPMEIAIRLPSLIASLLTSFYFFKLCRTYFSSMVSLILLAFVISNHTYILYSFMGRGYSFVNLFCVLAMYSGAKLSGHYSGKYRLVFIMSQFLGVFTVPSFLYVIFPIAVVVGIYVLKARSIKNVLLFMLDYLLVSALILGGYSGILFIGDDPSALFNLQSWTDKFTTDSPSWFNDLFFYLEMKFNEIFGFYRLRTALVLLITSTIFFIWKERMKSYFLCILSMFMFFSPFLIVILHGTYPYGRTWYYLLLPSAICVGFIFHAVEIFIRKINTTRKRMYFLMQGIIITICVLFLTRFQEWHVKFTPWDYEIRWLLEKKISKILAGVNEVSRTTSSQEFYPADMISIYRKYATPQKHIVFNLLDSIHGQEILIIDGNHIPGYRKELVSYELIFEHNNVWVYASDKLKRN